MSNFATGIDFTDDNQVRQYISIDGKHIYFDDARDAITLGIAILSVAKHFVHPTLYDRLPGDRQLLSVKK